MPNGKPGDNPITDTMIHGMHPFPPDLEKLIIELQKLAPYIFNSLEWEPFKWEQGKHLNEAKELIESLIKNYGDPTAHKTLIDAYKQKISNDQ